MLKHTRRFQGLDVIRGLSAVVVCLAHSYCGFVTPLVGSDNQMHKLINIFAYYAVLVFFVLSGFMITLSIVRNVEERGRFSPHAFFVSRMARIYPPLVFVLLLQGALALLINGLRPWGYETLRLPGDVYSLREGLNYGWKPFVIALLQLQSVFARGKVEINGPLWSLPYEFWIYVLAGAWSAYRFNGRTGFFVTLSVGLLFLTSLRNGRFAMYLVVWLLGALWAVAWKRQWLLRKSFRACALAGALTSAAVLRSLTLCFGIRRTWQGESDQRLMFSIVVCVLASFVVVLLIPWWKRMEVAVPRMIRGIAATADFSYTLYLIHFPILLCAMALIRPLIHTQGLEVQVGVWLLFNLFCIAVARWVAGFFEDRGVWLPVTERLMSKVSAP